MSAQTGDLFVRLSTKWWMDDKPGRCSMGARGLFTSMLSYCGDIMSDGDVSERGMMLVTAGCDADECARYVDELISAGLVVEGDGGLVIVGYAEWQTTRAEIDAKREKWRRQKKTKQAEVTEEDAAKPVDTVREDSTQGFRAESAKTPRGIRAPETETETDIEPEEDLTHSAPDGAGHPPPPSFADYWDAYPHKVDKSPARKAWDKLDADDKRACLDAVGRYVAFVDAERAGGFDLRWRGGAVFINKRTWEDDLEPRARAPVRGAGAFASNYDRNLRLARELEAEESARCVEPRAIGAGA